MSACKPWSLSLAYNTLWKIILFPRSKTSFTNPGCLTTQKLYVYFVIFFHLLAWRWARLLWLSQIIPYNVSKKVVWKKDLFETNTSGPKKKKKSNVWTKKIMFQLPRNVNHIILRTCKETLVALLGISLPVKISARPRQLSKVFKLSETPTGGWEMARKNPVHPPTIFPIWGWCSEIWEPCAESSRWELVLPQGKLSRTGLWYNDEARLPHLHFWSPSVFL